MNKKLKEISKYFDKTLIIMSPDFLFALWLGQRFDMLMNLLDWPIPLGATVRWNLRRIFD